ncbi:lactate dehydrogenase [Mycoplasma sp. 'Moose RK']|uniref:lactate dehydrogenase n=1 Tax=Mycoplasma sp. 'Moose RK' TaxID=2780095 RepID=UPI0018C289F5|nr:lactate dehydrogenase [Mycoplasma sp. 'Moose RK']MBG0730700.1 lactate dehydrogenase [Mycoplasma sp. 'Moose RK']
MLIGFIGITETTTNLIYMLIQNKVNADFLIIDHNFAKAKTIIDEFNLLINHKKCQNKIKFADFSSLKMANILIIESDQNLVPGMSLNDLALETAEWIYKISYQVLHASFNGITFILGHNSGILCKIFSAATGLIGKKVFGIGSNLENIELNLALEKVEQATKGQVFALGDYSQAFFVGKNLRKNGFSDSKIDKFEAILEKINSENLQNFLHKSRKNLFSALIIAEILIAIITEDEKFFLLNCWVESFYSIKNDFFSLPVKIDKTGQVELKNLELDQIDEQKLNRFVWQKNDLLDLISKYLRK